MVPCDVADYSDKEMLEIGLAENIQRQDLNPLEEAIVFQRLTRTGEYTIRELASRIGKNKDYVDGRLALLRAPQDVQDLVMKRPDTVTVARRIASLGSPGERRPLIEAVLEGTLNKEAVREIIRDLHTLEEPPVTEVIEVTAVLPDNVIALESSPVVRPDGQNKNKPASTAPKKAVKSSQYNTRRINQETSMVLSILNRWGELDPEIWQANHDSLNRSIQAIRDTLLELAELLAEAGGANLEQK
jgi:ParB family chromosome partitioning protein